MHVTSIHTGGIRKMDLVNQLKPHVNINKRVIAIPVIINRNWELRPIIRQKNVEILKLLTNDVDMAHTAFHFVQILFYGQESFVVTTDYITYTQEGGFTSTDRRCTHDDGQQRYCEYARFTYYCLRTQSTDRSSWPTRRFRVQPHTSKSPDGYRGALCIEAERPGYKAHSQSSNDKINNACNSTSLPNTPSLHAKRKFYLYFTHTPGNLAEVKLQPANSWSNTMTSTVNVMTTHSRLSRCFRSTSTSYSG